MEYAESNRPKGCQGNGRKEMKIMHRFLSHLIIAVTAIFLCVPAFSASNLSTGNIGDEGTWATVENRDKVIEGLDSDLQAFRPPVQLVDDYVPIEAKIGLAFMNAMGHISQILDNTLVRFIVIFIFLMFGLWIMFETYKMMTDGNGKIGDLWMSILKKGLTIAIWVVVLRYGVVQVFMWVVGPIVSIGTIVSDFILNVVSNTAGIQLPDTCAAIHSYVQSNVSDTAIMDATGLANILCVPTRMSGVAYTAVAAGWDWMISGIGSSLFTFLAGVVFIIMFLMVAWKFAFLALGVIADLFLGVMMLPFTAVKECLGTTKYQGIPGQIFNQFLTLFGAQSLSDQFNRFIQAALYFVSLAIVIAFCFALMAGTFSTDFTASRPSLENDGFWVSLLTAGLVWWFAARAMDIAKKLGGSIDASFGDKVEGDAKRVGKLSWDGAQKVWKIIRERNAKK